MGHFAVTASGQDHGHDERVFYIGCWAMQAQEMAEGVAKARAQKPN